MRHMKTIKANINKAQDQVIDKLVPKLAEARNNCEQVKEKLIYVPKTCMVVEASEVMDYYRDSWSGRCCDADGSVWYEYPDIKNDDMYYRKNDDQGRGGIKNWIYYKN